MSANRSSKRSGNRQGPTGPNLGTGIGSHSQTSAHGSSDARVPSGFKLANSDAMAPKTPPKGDTSAAFTLQFGTLSPGIMNGMQIPARTSSAPPNLDEQKLSQVRRGLSSIVPTLPIPPQQQARKDLGLTQPNHGEHHLSIQKKREVPVSIPSAPTVTTPQLSVLPIGGIRMATPFSHQQVPLQFGAPNPQHMYIPATHSHPLHTQAMMHQGQGMGFTPQMSHQLASQMSNMGLGIVPQYPPQQSPLFSGPRKTFVKITHPQTHKEMKFDKKPDPYMSNSSSSSSVQMPQPNVVPQSQPIPTFVPSHVNYYPPLQPNPYNGSSMFFPANPLTSTQMATGPQVPIYTHPIKQVGQSIPINNQTVVIRNPTSSSKLGPSPSHNLPVSANKPAPSSSVQKLKSDSKPDNILPSRDTSSTLAPPISTEKPVHGISSAAPLTPVGDYGSFKEVTDSDKTGPVRRPVSLKEHQKSEDKTETKHPSQHHQLDASDPDEVRNLSSTNIVEDCIAADAINRQDSSAPENIQDEDSLTSITIVPSLHVENSVLSEPGTPESGEDQAISTVSTSYRIMEGEMPQNGPPIEERVSSWIPKVEKNNSERQERVSASEHGKEDVSSYSSLDSSMTPVSTVTEPSFVNQERREDETTENLRFSVMNDGEKQNTTFIEAAEDESDISATSSLDFMDSQHVGLIDSGIPKVKLELEGKVKEASSGDSVPIAISGPKYEPFLDPTKTTATAPRKKKRKEILLRADAAGTSDLYNAYTGPQEKQEFSSSSKIIEKTLKIDKEHVSVDYPDKDAAASDEEEQEKADLDLDDWEEAADVSTPKLRTTDGEKETTRKKYSRDFLLTFAEHFNDLPMGFKIGSDIAEVLSSREPYPSPGRIIDRPSGVPRVDHRPRVTTGFIHGVLKNPRGITSGLIPSPDFQRGMPRNYHDVDKWHRQPGPQKGSIISPRTPLQVMHKAEKKYEVGKISDEEQAKQRQLKGILNKLTPQNFEKLFQQVKEVNIDNTTTLTGVISQIFDKALMEPTFCEMYANFCFHLAGALPDFSEENEKINFRRMLLNKCQEEFERGEREQAEAEKVEEEGEIKQSEAQREEKRIQVRRRMLGNIRLIGELYKKKMLTERIMHECIKKLLGQYQNPDEENIEALCKLMSTIGQMIDHSKAKEHMDAYFDMMHKLSTSQKLSSRVRFLLRDAIDLRKNKWQQRRKIDGPKKIADVHRDAAQERQAQTSRSSRGSLISPTPRRGPRGYAPDIRSGDRHHFDSRTLSVPLLQRPIDDDSITLGPQGGLARGMSIRGQTLTSNVPMGEIHASIRDSHRMASGPNGYSSINDSASHSSRDRIFDKGTTIPSAGRVHGNLNGVKNVPSVVQTLSEEALQEKSIYAIKEFYSAKEEKEVSLCIKELNSPGFYPSMVSLWISDSFERKDNERDLLAQLLVSLCKSCDSLITHPQLIEGFESVLSYLEDAVNDAPRAAEFLGRIFAKVVVEDVVSLREIGRLIYKGGEEPGSLLQTGLASEVLGSILEFVKNEKGDSILNEIRMSSELRLEDFRPPCPVKWKRLDAFL